MSQYNSIDMGMSAFVLWDNIDNILQHWANAKFNNAARSVPIKAVAERDDLSYYIQLQNLKPDDFNIWSCIFKKYDTKQEYDANEEFETVPLAPTLPSSMSLAILSDCIQASCHIGFKPKMLIANEYGLVLYEIAPTELTNYFTSEEEV